MGIYKDTMDIVILFSLLFTEFNFAPLLCLLASGDCKMEVIYLDLIVIAQHMGSA